MKRLLALFLCVLLLLTPALAAEYPDLPPEHWAYEAMDRAHTLGILTGHPDGTMAPGGDLTWGQYCTILARAFHPGIELQATAGAHWAAAALRAAEESGFLPAPLTLTEADLDRVVTRREAIVPLAQAVGNDADEALPPFTDWEELGTDFQPAVAALWVRGLVQGMPDGSFGGSNPLTRAAGCTLVLRVLDFLESPSAVQKPPEEGPAVEDPPEEAPVEAPPEEEQPAEEIPAEEPGPHVLTWEEALELVWAGEMSWDEYYMQDFWLTELGELPRKCVRLFGTADKRRFASQAEAEANVSQITVPVWKLNISTGEKTVSTSTLTVHSALADEVIAIFTEIFNDPEQFPIKNLGGYSWRGDASASEHCCGTAIDINWEENYQIYDNGTVGAGSYWLPGEDPFSIPADGSVVRIFAAHGFAWGGDAWPGSRDFMHFSYLGK